MCDEIVRQNQNNKLSKSMMQLLRKKAKISKKTQTLIVLSGGWVCVRCAVIIFVVVVRFQLATLQNAMTMFRLSNLFETELWVIA